MRKFVSEGKTYNGSDIQIIIDDATDDIAVTLVSPDGIVTKKTISGNNITDRTTKAVLDAMARYSEEESRRFAGKFEVLSEPYAIFTAAYMFDIKDIIESPMFKHYQSMYTAARRAEAKLDGLQGKRKVLSVAVENLNLDDEHRGEARQLLSNLGQALNLDEQYEIRSDFKELHSTVAPNTTSELVHEIFREHCDKVDKPEKGGA